VHPLNFHTHTISRLIDHDTNSWHENTIRNFVITCDAKEIIKFLCCES
jgi:hypothetical protein